MRFFRALDEEILSEIKVEHAINLLKDIEQEEKAGMFKKVKTFPDAALKKLFSEIQFINGASPETIVPILKRAGFSDQQISKVKPYFIEKIKATDQNTERIDREAKAQGRTGVINPRGRSTAATGVRR